MNHIVIRTPMHLLAVYLIVVIFGVAVVATLWLSGRWGELLALGLPRGGDRLEITGLLAAVASVVAAPYCAYRFYRDLTTSTLFTDEGLTSTARLGIPPSPARVHATPVMPWHRVEAVHPVSGRVRVGLDLGEETTVLAGLRLLGRTADGRPWRHDLMRAHTWHWEDAVVFALDRINPAVVQPDLLERLPASVRSRLKPPPPPPPAPERRG